MTGLSSLIRHPELWCARWIKLLHIILIGQKKTLQCCEGSLSERAVLRLMCYCSCCRPYWQRCFARRMFLRYIHLIDHGRPFLISTNHSSAWQCSLLLNPSPWAVVCEMKDASYNHSYSPTLRASMLRRVFIRKAVLRLVCYYCSCCRTLLTKMLRCA